MMVLEMLDDKFIIPQRQYLLLRAFIKNNIVTII